MDTTYIETERLIYVHVENDRQGMWFAELNSNDNVSEILSQTRHTFHYLLKNQEKEVKLYVGETGSTQECC